MSRGLGDVYKRQAMNIEIKNIHAIQSLVEHHSEKVISISGKADNSKAKEILELAHKKNIKINIKDKKLIAYCKEPSVKDLKNSNYNLGELVLILDEVQDTRNLGSCLRSASFLGWTQLLFLRITLLNIQTLQSLKLRRAVFLTLIYIKQPISQKQ